MERAAGNLSQSFSTFKSPDPASPATSLSLDLILSYSIPIVTFTSSTIRIAVPLSDMAAAAATAAATMGPEPRASIQHNQSDLPPSSIAETVNELYNAPTNGVAPEQYSGEGEDDAPRSPVRKPHKKTGSLRMNGHKRDKEGSSSQLMIEKFQDRDGEHLTTIRQYRPFGRTETKVRRSDELVSGRRVGTKWERSQYAVLSDTLVLLDCANSSTHTASILHRSPCLSNGVSKP